MIIFRDHCRLVMRVDIGIRVVFNDPPGNQVNFLVLLLEYNLEGSEDPRV